MIICKNCGAEYDDEQDRCPYCGGITLANLSRCMKT